jgi:hypothetical protein
MPIRFWYLPFAMFSGGCDLALSEPEMQVDEDPANFDVGPDEEANSGRERLILRGRGVP